MRNRTIADVAIGDGGSGAFECAGVVAGAEAF
jgi:hypothetical protein